MADFTPGKRALILLEDDSPCLYPAFTIASDDLTIAGPADGGNYRHAVVAVAAGTCTVTATRASDGATATVEVTVVDVPPPDPLPPFTVHLGEPY